MNLERIKITLPGAQRDHSFELVERDGELKFEANGQVVATLSVSTMTKDVRDEEGDYHTKLSDNFYINFFAVDPVAKADCSAMVWMEQQ